MTVLASSQSAVGLLIRDWRRRRRLSQLQLSIRADISTRHLSFLETGRSAPSRDMVLQLANRLDVPLRDRNHMLLAAGYFPVYPENPLHAPAMGSVRAALHQVLAGHNPYPAIVVDKRWNLVEANATMIMLTRRVAPALLARPYANVLRASLHPDGLAPHIVNLGEWRAHLLGRLLRQVEFSGDAELAELAEELRGYPCDQAEPEVGIPGPREVMVPLRIRTDLGELALFGTVAAFGTPLDVTVSELSIELFYPSDESTADVLRRDRTADPGAPAPHLRNGTS